MLPGRNQMGAIPRPKRQQSPTFHDGQKVAHRRRSNNNRDKRRSVLIGVFDKMEGGQQRSISAIEWLAQRNGVAHILWNPFRLTKAARKFLLCSTEDEADTGFTFTPLAIYGGYCLV